MSTWQCRSCGHREEHRHRPTHCTSCGAETPTQFEKVDQGGGAAPGGAGAAAPRRRVPIGLGGRNRIQAPAIPHKYKLLHYVPSTTLGRFGLEFDPAAGVVKVVVKAFFVMEVDRKEPFRQSMGAYARAFAERCTRTWSNRYRLTGPGRSFDVRFLIDVVGQATLPVSGMETLEDGPPEVLRRFEASGAHFLVILKKGRNQSHLSLREGSRAANVVLFEAAFDETHGPALSGAVLNGELRHLSTALAGDEDGAGAPPLVPPDEPMLSVTRSTMQHPPMLAVAFGPGSDALPAPVAEVLRRVAEDVQTRNRAVTLKVFVVGSRAADEDPGGDPALEQRRADAVAAVLRQRLPADLVVEEPPVVAGADAAPEDARAVRLYFGYHTGEQAADFFGQEVRYGAAVHEFGHALGLPDEYVKYRDEGQFRLAAPSQPRLRALCAAEGVPDWPPLPDEGERHAADLMNAGENFHKRYYLTILEAVRTVVGLRQGGPDPARYQIGDPPDLAGPVQPLREDADFAPLAEAVQAGVALLDQGITDVQRIKDAMQQRLQHHHLPERYIRVLQANDGTEAADIPDENTRLLLAVGSEAGGTRLHVASCGQARRIQPVVEMPDAYRADAGTVLLHPPANPVRQAVRLRSTGLFEGHGTLSCSIPGVRFFLQEEGGAALDLGGHAFSAADLAQGTTVYAEGDLADATLRLRLHSATSLVQDAAVQLTVQQPPAPYLDVYSVSVDPNEPPQLLDASDRADFGAVIPLKAGREGLRFRVDVVRPAGFNARLKVRLGRPIRETRRILGDAHKSPLGLYAARQGGREKGTNVSVRQDGEKTYYREFELPRNAFANGDRYTLWVQGERLSLAPQDATIQLISVPRRAGRRVVPAEHDACTATVVSFTDLHAQLPVTPSLTPRILADGSPPAPPPCQAFRAGDLSDAAGVYASRNFDDNPPFVLVRGSVAPEQPALMRVTMQPMMVPMQWHIRRAEDDHADLTQASALDETAPLECLDRVQHQGDAATRPREERGFKIPTDGVGSFHLCLTVGKSTLAMANMVLAGVEAVDGGDVQPQVALVDAHKQAILLQGFTPQGILKIRTGDLPFPDPAGALDHVRAHACAVLAGRLRVTGGGPDKRRGADRVCAGWIQNKTHTAIRGTYTNMAEVPDGAPRHAEVLFVRNQREAHLLRINEPGAVQPIADWYFRQQDGHEPDPLGPPGPLLDTGRDATLGGASATLGTTHLVRREVDGGIELDAFGVDCPGTEFHASHPSDRGALLTHAQYEHDFRAYLCVWTTSVRQEGGGWQDRGVDNAGAMLFGVAADVAWTIRGAWDVTWPPADFHGRDADGIRALDGWLNRPAVAADVDFVAHISQPFTRYPSVVPAAGLVEVRPPTPLDTFAWDARLPAAPAADGAGLNVADWAHNDGA